MTNSAEKLVKQTIKLLAKTQELDYEELKIDAKKLIKAARNLDESMLGMMEEIMDLGNVGSQEELEEFNPEVLKIYCRIKEIDEAAVRANSTTHRSGRYITQLSQFTQYFDRNQILIINSQSLFLNSSLYMESIRNFLNLPRYKPWEGKFPKEEHIGYTSQLGLVDCVLKHIPELDCDFRDLLGQYYLPYNKDLDNWLAKTPNKSAAELPFSTFGDDHRKIDCVKDARQEFQKILKKDRTLSCTSSK